MQDAQVALVVYFSAILERLKLLDHLNGQPVALVLDLAQDHLFEALQATLLGNGELAVVGTTLLELIAKRFGKLKLRLLLLIQALVILLERA